MLARFSRVAVKSVAAVSVKPAAPVSAVRFLGTNLHHGDKDVVIPELVDTLEWVLDSPCPIHQFEEPPIIVEIEHLNNVKGPAEH